ncbi:MAG: hypothetical protein R3E68_16070 [Burkholderiaceae bacterium]
MLQVGQHAGQIGGGILSGRRPGAGGLGRGGEPAVDPGFPTSRYTPPATAITNSAMPAASQGRGPVRPTAAGSSSGFSLASVATSSARASSAAASLSRPWACSWSISARRSRRTASLAWRSVDCWNWARHRGETSQPAVRSVNAPSSR